MFKSKALSDDLSECPSVLAKEVRFVGNTIFADEELLEIAKPYIGTSLASEKLLELKNKITQHYIDHGYINSGAVLPDQDISDGVILYEIKEGTLGDIILTEKGRFNSHYLLSRIRRNYSGVLNIFDLQKTLKLLEQDPNVRLVNASLEPGAEPGSSSLVVSVEDVKRFYGGVSIDNYGPASIGAYTTQLYGEAHNLLGWGEILSATFGWRLDDELNFRSDENLLYDAGISVPVNRWDTRLSASYSKNFSTIVSEQLSVLNIENETENFVFGVRHPFFRDLRKELGLALGFNHEKVETRILGDAFLIAPTNLSSVSFAQDMVYRTSEDVFVVYSNFDFGVDLFLSDGEKPLNAKGEETVNFVTWLFQLQYLRRLQFLDSQILLKASTRLADRPLPVTERFQIGGHATVRGYRENTFVLDEAFLFSIDYQVPLMQLKAPYISKESEDGQTRLSVFYDYAKGENKDSYFSPPDISSVGLGFHWQLNTNSYSKIIWGLPLREIDYNSDSDLQDAGIHVELSMGF